MSGQPNDKHLSRGSDQPNEPDHSGSTGHVRASRAEAEHTYNHPGATVPSNSEHLAATEHGNRPLGANNESTSTNHGVELRGRATDAREDDAEDQEALLRSREIGTMKSSLFQDEVDDVKRDLQGAVRIRALQDQDLRVQQGRERDEIADREEAMAAQRRSEDEARWRKEEEDLKVGDEELEAADEELNAGDEMK